MYVCTRGTLANPTCAKGFLPVMMHQQNPVKPLALFLLFFGLILCFSDGLLAQKRSGGKKKSVKKSSNKASNKTARSSGPIMKFIYGDAFIGPSINYASGDYLEYQKQYYSTANPNFKIQGKFTNHIYFTAGAQARCYPFRKPKSILSGLAFSGGFSFLQKGFKHEIGFANTALDYLDETRINDQFLASFLSTHLMARFGKRLYIEAGISLDWFLSGIRSQEIIRKTSGDNAYLGGFETKEAIDYNLTTKTMARQSVGWVFGLGYQITHTFGCRFYNNFNKGFFKDGDLSNYQPSVQVTISLP